MRERLTKEERAQRLVNYMKSISGEKSVESYMQVSTDNSALESMGSKVIRTANDTVEQVLSGRSVPSKELVAVEAIIHKTKRPSHRVKNGKFDPFDGEFAYLTEKAQTKQRIFTTLASIGRIDTPDLTIYGGTGFVVGKNLIMTNRHVAEIFTNGVGSKHVSIRLKNSEIDFQEEPVNVADGYRLTKCVMVHPYWDMALFQAELPDLEPLNLTVQSYDDLLGQDVVVVGYPARDPRNALDVQRQIFGDDFEIKRIAPGRVARRQRDITSQWLSRPVEALAHDASTLGGNSGSAVISVETGQVIALHFAGRYLIENYGVPCHELARDPRVVDAGLNFDHCAGLPTASTDLDQFWHSIEGETAVSNGQRSTRVPAIPSTCQTLSGNSVSIEIPLKITVSLGDMLLGDLSPAGTPSQSAAGQSGDSRAGESAGSGYDVNFLSEPVATPKLPSDLLEDAFQLNHSHLIPYTHFSVCQSKSRTLPRFVAWNIDGSSLKALSRKNIPFVLDRRIPEQFQAGDELYRNNRYDRGHVARRADLNWGPLAEAGQANKDSFFFTNMTPQHERFNQSQRHGLWGELENAIFADVDVQDLRISVMAGPLLQADDPVYRNVKIPRDFWKLIAFQDTTDDQFKVSAYVLSQSELVATEALELDLFHLYQVSLAKLKEISQLNFDGLAQFDTFSSVHESLAGSGVREVLTRNQVLV